MAVGPEQHWAQRLCKEGSSSQGLDPALGWRVWHAQWPAARCGLPHTTADASSSCPLT